MEFYKEYPIRCKTCGGQIACFAPDYEQLLSAGDSREAALTRVGLEPYCCRAAMLNPPIVTFDMENREVIEGFINADTALETDPYWVSTGNPIFTHCISDMQYSIPGGFVPKLTPSAPPPIASRTSTSNALSSVGLTVAEPPQYKHSIIPGLEPKEPKAGIPLNLPITPDTFVEPTIPGVPVINPVYPLERIKVGAGKEIQKLTGRSYLAR